MFQKIKQLLRSSFSNEQHDFTTLSIHKSIFLLAIPMMFEMLMESLFSIVDTYFVSELGRDAIATVGLTESLLTIVYSIGIGLSMAATAIVARRVGEKNYNDAAKAGAQAIVIGIGISIIFSIVGIVFAKNLLKMMGASNSIINYGYQYTQVALGSNVVIMLLFLINGIFRGMGSPNIAFRSLLISNALNIIFCPIMIGQFGIVGAALATLLGRGIGVVYQLIQLNKKEGVVTIANHMYQPDWKQIKSILNIAATTTLQFLIASGSWIFLNKLITNFGDDAVAGYTLAIRILVFFILPAWGISNAAATMVGQNLGAKQPDRAQKAVFETAKVNAIFMALVTITCQLFGKDIIRFFTNNENLIASGAEALQIISLGYVVYGIGMVILNAFNGAGDSKTPSIINFFGYWCFQIPLAYLLSNYFELGKYGIFYSIIIAETLVLLTSIFFFKKGKWKLKEV
jgi:putative MATE family efflux protein